MDMLTITWRSIEIDISYVPEKFNIVDHIELHTDPRNKLPVTETGYRSNFIPAGTVASHGGPEAFVTAWLDHEADAAGWNGDQLSLF